MILRPLMQSKYRRVQMAWPDSHPRYFGKLIEMIWSDLLSQFLTRIVYAAFAPVCKSTGGLSMHTVVRTYGGPGARQLSIYWTKARLVGRNGLAPPG
jgi:hypothetical protein